MNHQEHIVDQFTKQAVPFSTASSMADPQAIELLVKASGANAQSTVLDVACGPGLVVRAFAEIARHVSGVDVTPAMIERASVLVAQREFKNVDLQVHDASDLPYANESFDVVVTRFSFHHFANPAAVLAEMRRVCKPNGRVVVCDAFASDDHAKAESFNCMEKLRDPSTARFLTLHELQSLLDCDDLKLLDKCFYRVPAELERLLAVSFPPPGGEATLREMFAQSVATDGMGLGAHYKNSMLLFHYPAVILVAERTA
jgi:ubiquinone/menaquinone biosynthesis C-methylase UbiE